MSLSRSIWSNTPPRHQGVYWYRGPDHDDVAQLVRVFRDAGGEMSVQYGNIDAEMSVEVGEDDDHVDYLANWRGEWCGPISPPREP